MPKKAKQRTEEPEPIKAIKKIAEQLSSSSYQERAKGEEALLEMGDDGPESFAQLMRYEAARIQMERKRAWGTLRNWVLIALVFWGVHLIHRSFQSFNGVQVITLLNILGTLWVVSSLAQNRAAIVLMRYYDDIRIVGPLLEALEYRKLETYRLAVKKLTELLPQMQMEDLERLDSRQRDCLRNALASKNPAFVLHVLQALEQLEDTAALPGVEPLVCGDGAGRHKEVYNAALRCYKILQARRDQEQAAQTLLRPSAEQTPPDMLLRPVEETYSASGEQLLRASTQDAISPTAIQTTIQESAKEPEVVLRVKT